MQVLLEYFIDLVIQWKEEKRCMTARDSLDEHHVMAKQLYFLKKTQQCTIVCDNSVFFQSMGYGLVDSTEWRYCIVWKLVFSLAKILICLVARSFSFFSFPISKQISEVRVKIWNIHQKNQSCRIQSTSNLERTSVLF